MAAPSPTSSARARSTSAVVPSERELLERGDVVGEGGDPRRVALVVDPTGEPPQAGERPLLADPRGDVRDASAGRGGAAPRPTSPLDQRVGGRDGQAQPRQRGHARRCARRNSAPTPPLTRDARPRQRDLNRRQQRVDPREHGDVGRRAAVGRSPRGRRRRWHRASRPPSRSRRPAAAGRAARITLATRRRLWRTSRSAAATTSPGQR